MSVEELRERFDEAPEGAPVARSAGVARVDEPVVGAPRLHPSLIDRREVADVVRDERASLLDGDLHERLVRCLL